MDLEYHTRIISSLSQIGQPAWDALVSTQQDANPFLSFAFLNALHETGCASLTSGWQPHFLTLWRGGQLCAAMPLYLKAHSYGEYVFDWAWADAYQRHGLEYYPKLLSSIPFTPVTGSRLLACNPEAATELVAALCREQQAVQVSSTHILYPPPSQAAALQQAGYLLRTGVQFHWINNDYHSFDDFLETLDRKKRKNIRAERRKVYDARVVFRHVPGIEATEQDWRFFKRCYDHTYAAHCSTPYLNLDFFLQIGRTMPDNLLLIVAERGGKPIASSLCFYTDSTLYGRYWGAIEQVSCLHFETAYYQPLEFCIAHGLHTFEGGAQGEHKMARGFMPQKTWSAHWLAHPAFADAIERFLEREANGIESYIDELQERNPFRP